LKPKHVAVNYGIYEEKELPLAGFVHLCIFAIKGRNTCSKRTELGASVTLAHRNLYYAYKNGARFNKKNDYSVALR
jgi:hypothetical protein